MLYTIVSSVKEAHCVQYYSYNVNPTLSRERMNEAHDLIIQAWTRPGPFAFEGEHYNYRYVNIWPRPIQQPHPPIWLPGTASRETIDFAAQRKYPYMTVFMTMDQRKAAYNLYRRLAEEKYGYEASPEQLAFCTPCVVAETDEQAMKDGEHYVMWLFNKAMKLRPEFNFPPGYISESSFAGLLKSGVWQRTGKPGFKELVETGVVIAGSVDTVIEKLAYYTDELHAGMMVSGCHVGEIPEELVLKQQELMAKGVMPHFRDKPSSTEPKPIEISTTSSVQ